MARSLGIDRRTFISLAVASAVVAPAAAGASEVDAPQRVSDAATAARAWNQALIVNALGAIGNPNPVPDPKQRSGQGAQGTARHARRTLDERVLCDARASGITAVNVTLGYVAGSVDPFEYTISSIGEWEALIRAYSGDLLKVCKAADIEKAKADGKIGIIYGFQNAAMVGGRIERIDRFCDLGVRVIQLTYNPANQIGDGSMAPENRGLTAFGREVIDRLNQNRIMVDLSHSGERTCLEAARVSKQPISINHTGCRALVDLPRNKTDEELRLVAAGGGFVGIYFMPYLNASGHATADDVLAHIDHAINVCGEDHVGIGTDGPVTAIDDIEGYRAYLAAEVEGRRAMGIGATGERADTFPFVMDLRGVNQFYELADRLQRRGYSSARVEKILGRNFLRYAREVWAA